QKYLIVALWARPLSAKKLGMRLSSKLLKATSSMKSKASAISELTWKSSLISLNNGKSTKTIEALVEANIQSIFDLVWIFPLRLKDIPGMQNFSSAQDGALFLGEGQVINTKITPAFGKRGKGRVQLFNISLVVKDPADNHYLTLRWF